MQKTTKRQVEQPASMIWAGRVSHSTEQLMDWLATQKFEEPIAWDPHKQIPYEPSCAKGSSCIHVGRDSPQAELLWALFEQEILPQIWLHDTRDLRVHHELTISKLVHGNQLPWHDDLAEKRFADGTFQQAPTPV